MYWLARIGPIFLALMFSVPGLGAASSEAIDGISFAKEPHVLFAPVEEIASALGWQMQFDQTLHADGQRPPLQISLNRHLLDAASLRKLTNGTLLVPLDELQRAGATIAWCDDGMEARVESNYENVTIQFANKRVEVDLAKQRLRAYQGARLVLDSPISTGREGRKTPPGKFKAGPIKSPMHRSRLYHNAPMPWSVQVYENIFIHGFRKVPRRPASHGCIRLPLTGANPAKWFYDWIDIGTPIEIKGHWPIPTPRPGVEKAARIAGHSTRSIHKVVIAIVTTIIGGAIIFFVWRSRRKPNESTRSTDRRVDE